MAKDPLQELLDELGLSGGAEEPASTAVQRWSTTQSGAFQHQLTVQWLRELGVASGIAGDLANQLADEWRTAHNGRWPTATNIIANPKSMNAIEWYASGFYALPAIFGVKDAAGKISYYTNSPTEGLVPMTRGFPPTPPGHATRYPIYSVSEINKLAGGASSGFLPSGGGGGGGGGGGAPAAPKPLVLDRAPLVEQASEMWRSTLLEEPPNAGGIVDEYLTKANTFWQQGGQLDFDSFINEKIRATGRHKVIYSKKPAQYSEAQWIGQYLGALRQMGIAPRNEAKLAVSGAQYGASQQGFQERIQRGAEYMTANSGNFSQKFANTIAGMGIRGT